MIVVIDASVVLAWLYPDEHTPAVRGVFANSRKTVYSVPRLWHLEVVNVLLMNMRRGKYNSARLNEYLETLQGIDVGIDEQTELHAWTATLKLAVQHRLTSYDACYLELAIRLGASLATLDGDLRRAASAEGVALLGM